MKRNLNSGSPAVATASASEELQTNVTLSQEEIAAVAFSYWQERGCQGGSAEEDWLHAEQELKGKAATGRQTLLRRSALAPILGPRPVKGRLPEVAGFTFDSLGLHLCILFASLHRFD